MLPGLKATVTKGEGSTTPPTFRKMIAESPSRDLGEKLGPEAHPAASL